MKDSKQDFRKGDRDIDREIRAIERDEAKLIVQIKQVAKNGDTKSAQIHVRLSVALALTAIAQSQPD